MKKTMLYHSFPRPRENNPSGKGIKILNNILKYGLLLVPEVQKYRGKKDMKNNMGEDLIMTQCRFSMTALDDISKLEEHAKFFGNIHLEFTPQSVYEMGAIPVIYIPENENDNTNSLWNLAYSILHRLYNFKKIVLMLEELDKNADIFADEKEIEIEIETEAGKLKYFNVSQLRDTLELILKNVVDLNDDRKTKEMEFSQMQGAIQGMCSLFYFTDNYREKDNPYLYYFRQHEWRIVQGMSVSGTVQDKEIVPKGSTDTEVKDAILAVDSCFFGKELGVCFDGVKPKIIDLCRLLSEVNGKKVQEYINRILIPVEYKKEALEIITANVFPIEKVYFYNDIDSIEDNIKGAKQ